MPDESESPQKTQYSLSFSLDRDNFLRRECPSCGRHFKTKVEPADLVAIVQPAFRQAGQDIGEVRPGGGMGNNEESPALLRCPYCGFVAEASEMITAALADYIKRYIYREVLLPKVDRLFSDVERSFNRPRSRSRGFLSLEVTFKHEDIMLPPRPISGPEPPDMTTVDLMCCGKQIKILDGWCDVITCPHCSTADVLQ